MKLSFWKIVKVSAAVLLAAGVSWYVLPFLDRHEEQDRCEFDTGSTALYKQLRAEADDYLRKNGKLRLGGYSGEPKVAFSTALTDQVRDFAMSRATSTERWAAMHALLRAYGMEFDVNWPPDANERTSPKLHLRATYIVLLPKLTLTCPLCYVFREATFNMTITNRGDGVFSEISGYLKTTPLNPKHSPIYISRSNQICPLVLK